MRYLYETIVSWEYKGKRSYSDTVDNSDSDTRSKVARVTQIDSFCRAILVKTWVTEHGIHRVQV